MRRYIVRYEEEIEADDPLDAARQMFYSMLESETAACAKLEIFDADDHFVPHKLIETIDVNDYDFDGEDSYQ